MEQTMKACWCETCRPDRQTMIVCPDCGNKRCPKATHHDNPCTGSNEPGQRGSSWEHCPKAPMATPAADGGARPRETTVDVDAARDVVFQLACRARAAERDRDAAVAERDALRRAVEDILVGTDAPDYAAKGCEYPERMFEIWEDAQNDLLEKLSAALAPAAPPGDAGTGQKGGA